MPTFSPHSTQKPTWINQAAPTTAHFDDATVHMGEEASSGTSTSNGLIAFDLSSLAGTVTGATLTFAQPHDTGGSFVALDRTIRVFRCKRAWTTGATWQKYDGTNNWTTAGGINSTNDYDATNFFDFDMPDNLGTDVEVVDDAGLIALVQDAIDNRSGLLSLICFGLFAGLGGTEEWLSFFSANMSLDVTIDATPSVQAHTVTEVALTDTTAEMSWTRGNGANCAVFVKQTTSGTAAPVNNTTYTANAAFGSGTQIGSTGWYCVYKGTGTSVTVTGLTGSTAYRMMVCEFNGGAGSEDYNTDAASGNPANFTTDASIGAPTSQATNIISIDTGTFYLNLSWTRGDGDKCAVFIRQGGTGTAAPVDETTYVQGETFGEGDEIGSSGWYCIYNGTENSALVVGLTPSTRYRVMVCEYNGDPGEEMYNASTATGNPQDFVTASEGAEGRPWNHRPWGNRVWRERAASKGY